VMNESVEPGEGGGLRETGSRQTTAHGTIAEGNQVLTPYEERRRKHSRMRTEGAEAQGDGR